MNYTSKAVYEKISQETNDPIVEWKVCEVSGAEFPITQKDLKFYAAISPTFGWEKYQIPTPRLCPEERQIRRLLFRNERKLYRRKCDATGESMISMYTEDSVYKIYNTKTRWSDSWNPLDYSLKDMNWMSIVQVLDSLTKNVPKVSLINDDVSENSNYVNQTTYLKGCYLVFDADHCESCLYSSGVKHGTSLVDCLWVHHSQECYGCVNGNGLNGCIDCTDCDQSQNLIACERCTWCSYCYGCTNLSNATYCIYNKQVSKEEYQEFIANTSSHKKSPSSSDYPRKNFSQTKSTKSSGNALYESKNAVISYDITNWTDIKYCSLLNDVHDCYDYDVRWDNCEMMYECETVGDHSSFMWFCRGCWWGNTRLWYCVDTMWSQDCFGCVGLRNAQYCIFNRQCTKEQYEKIVPQVIKQMQQEWTRGEFFDASLSPFGYNETVAYEYYPLMKKDAILRWYHRQDKNYDPVVPDGIETLSGDQIPLESINVDESILKKILLCEDTGRPYRIVKQELEFYKKHAIPLPRKHPDGRHLERMQKRPWRTLYLRKCDKTWEEIISVYPSDYKWKVYSASAYQQEVYW